MQAAFEQKMIAGMITSVKPKAPSKALLNAADLEIPFAMNVMAATQDFLKKNPEQVERALKGYIEGVAVMVHDKQTAFRVLAEYLKRNDPGFLEEMYAIAYEFTDRVPRVDARTVATVLEFERVQGVDPTTLSRKVIDNSMVEKLVKDGFIEKVFSKGIR